MSTDSSSVKHFIYQFPRSGNPCSPYYVLLLLFLAVPAGCYSINRLGDTTAIDTTTSVYTTTDYPIIHFFSTYLDYIIGVAVTIFACCFCAGCYCACRDRAFCTHDDLFGATHARTPDDPDNNRRDHYRYADGYVDTDATRYVNGHNERGSYAGRW
jgi:hypothetical protein